MTPASDTRRPAVADKTPADRLLTFPRSVMFVGGVAGIAVVYYLAAKLGLQMAPLGAEQVTPVWPPTGIAIAALLLLGLRFWPGVALGAFLANVTAPHEYLGTALGIATGNTLEAVTAVWLLRRVAHFSVTLERLKDVLAFLVLAAVGSTAVSATIGVLSLCASRVQEWNAYGPLWSLWWLGDVTGALLVAPVFLAWANWPARHWDRKRLLEAVALLVGLLFVDGIVFGGRLDTAVSHHPVEYTVFPFIIWAALRFGQPGTTIATFVTSGMAIWGTVGALGPFGGGMLHESLIMLQAFMGVVAMTGLLLSAAITERATAEKRRAVDFAVTQILAQAGSLDEAAPRILDVICQDCEWDVGALWLVDRQANVIRCKEVRQRPSVQTRNFQAISLQSHFERGVGLPGRVWDKGAATWVPDVTLESNFPRKPFARQEGLRGALAFPISLGSEITGVVEFFSREIRQPDVDLLHMFATVGSQIGHFIERHESEKRHRQMVEQRAAQLAEADRRKDEFLAMLAHELRNPLAPLRNALEILKMRGADATMAGEAREMMERQLQQLVRLVDDLLDVSRINRGKIQLRKECIDLSAAISRAIETTRPVIDARGHELIVSLPDEPLTVEADRTRLAQVVANLLNNAAKYTEKAGRIWLTAERAGAEVVIRVRDTGIGIRPDLLPHVFDLFVQSERSLERSQGGLGIGLTLVRSLVEMHGGSVTAQSEGVGKGSEFIFRLPVLVEQTQAETRGADARPAAALPRRRVLVVDDNVDAAESLAMLLRISGQDVRVAHNGPAALETAAAYHPELVLLDIGLPGMTGYEVAERLRAQAGFDGTVLAAVTGYGQEEDRRRSRAAGIDYHLVKPVELEAVEAILTTLAKSAVES
jgi:signal transduction histidine kinase/integral membrane sensor domain MASE1/ActR/RegA family two-component response regulator